MCVGSWFIFVFFGSVLGLFVVFFCLCVCILMVLELVLLFYGVFWACFFFFVCVGG